MIIGSALRPLADVMWEEFDYNSPLHERWYSGDMGLSSGEPFILGPETLLRCGTVLAAVRFLGDAYAMCPPQTFRRVSDDIRRPEPEHYSQRLLRNPNAWQTGYRWRHTNMVWAALWGNSYNKIIPAAGTGFGALLPGNPSQCKVVDQRGSGELVYRYFAMRPAGALQPREEILGQEEVLHFRGLSTDGASGVHMYALIRNTVMIALLAQRHTTTFLRKGSRLAGLLAPAVKLDQKQVQEVVDSWVATMGGPDATGTVGVLPYGMDFKPVSMDNQKAQLVELTDQTVEAILQFLGVPGIVVGYQGDKASTYASADAFFEKGGIKHCVMPWVLNFEEEEAKALIYESQVYIRHNMDALLRANTKDMYEAIFKATGRPWQTGNEARKLLDMNPVPQEDMNEVAEPSNMTGSAADNVPQPEPLPPSNGGSRRSRTPPDQQQEDEAMTAAQLERVLIRDAKRIVRREIAAAKAAAARFSSRPDSWRRWAEDYYQKHAEHVAEALEIPELLAREYAENQRLALVLGGVGVIEAWETDVTPRLAALAMNGVNGHV